MYEAADYDLWNSVKKKIATRESPLFHEREVWITSIGLNIGTEMNGKQQLYMRPVLVLRKLNRHQFIGVPLSTKQQESLYSVALGAVHFLVRDSACICTHMRTYSSKRLQRRIGRIAEKKWLEVIQKSAGLLTPPQVPFGNNAMIISPSQ